jgi:hypothetical protein
MPRRATDGECEGVQGVVIGVTAKEILTLAPLLVVVGVAWWIRDRFFGYLMSRPDLQTRLRLQRRSEWQKQHRLRK